MTDNGTNISAVTEATEISLQLNALCELNDLNDKEIGKGMTSIVIITSEHLSSADELAKQKINPR